MIMERRNVKENMMDDVKEFEKLLGEIPLVTSHYQCSSNGVNVFNADDHNLNGNGNGNGTSVMTSGCGVYNDGFRSFNYNNYRNGNGSSPGSGFSLHSDGSSGHPMSENGSITPPPNEDLRLHLNSGNYRYSNGVRMEEIESRVGYGNYGRFDGMRLGSGMSDNVNELGLCRMMNKMHIGGEMDNGVGFSGFLGLNQPGYGYRQAGFDEFVSLGESRKGFLGFEGVQSSVARSMLRTQGAMHPALFDSQQRCGVANFLEPPMGPRHSDVGLPQWNCHYRPLNVPWEKSMERQNHNFRAASSLRNMNPSFRRPSAENDLSYARRNGVTFNQVNGMFRASSCPLGYQMRQRFTVDPAVGYGDQDWRARQSLNTAIQRGNFEAPKTEGNVILQGECSNFMTKKDYSCTRGQTKGYVHRTGPGKRLVKRLQLNGQPQNGGNDENGPSDVSFNPVKYSSLGEAQGKIYPLAKDQHGCRFLQKMFDEGAPEDVQLIFKEIADHVVELMMNTFGNYLIQKLLDVCSEEHKMQILLMVTEKPGELVQISLNSHGTRVVQKLIETLKDRRQISLVISALEPGFLTLMKDLNGNHVVQHCLQYFTSDDNRFIFIAAAKHCVEIATHQHGCCVLQGCISYSTGQYRENLVNEISANGLLLAQDRYGNYVVQFVLDLKSPSATSNFITQFEGHYVQLSTQKCSSNVVQRCIATFEAENCSRVIHELLSTARFEQLLQDPFANYVISTALEVSQEPLKNILIKAIEPYRAILRNGPFSKRIYSLLWRN